MEVVQYFNYICRFGENKRLMNYLDEIVLPSFLDRNLQRDYESTRYFFHSVAVELVGRPPRRAIVGQFVKDMVVESEQKYEEGQGLIKTHARLPMSPSAFFILYIESHKLVYMPETRFAPPYSAFRSTSARFLKQKWRKFVDLTYDSRQDKRTTKKKIIEINPVPTLDVVPLASMMSIDQFLRNYKKLQRIEFRLIDPNDEIDGEAVFEKIREFKENIGASKTILSHQSKDGLKLKEAKTQIHQASAGGNQEVTLRGLDENGNSLIGNNENFNLKTAVKEIPPTREGKVALLDSAFRRAVETGELKLDRGA